MKFLRNRSLKHLALSLLGGLFLLFLFEFILIKYRIDSLQESEEKKDYARGAQLDGQQLAYVVELHMDGQDAAVEIYARVQELDNKLTTLGSGGRIDRTEIILDPLPRLPAITFASLQKSWMVYKASVLQEIDQSPIESSIVPTQTDSVNVAQDSLSRDSSTDQVANIVVKSETAIPGQWLTLSNWFNRLLVDLDEETEKKKNSVENWFIFFAILDLILIGSLYFAFNRYILEPLAKLKQNTALLHKDDSLAGNEIGEVATEVNAIVEQLKDASEFVAAIGSGNQDFDYSGFNSKYNDRKNKLADSLLTMQSKLKDLNEEEQKRQWANEGLTKFVDILRSSNDDITALGDKIISALVKYTNANQGGLYLLNDEDERNRHLELISLFAFDNKKFDKQKVKLGEGILGQTFLEKETTLLNDIPDEYVRITSGLGSATPKSLLIVPLKVDKDVYGIVELASFKNFQPHEIDFVEKLAETIASTLGSVKAAQKNRNLIEQFQQQTEEMRAQEEEMRQNMEELQATQEELARKEQDYILRIRELEGGLEQGVSPEQHQKLRDELSKQINDHQAKIRELERRLAEKPAREDDWALASEVEKQLRQQLEALRITQQAGK